MATKRKTPKKPPTNQEPVCKGCGAAMNTPFDQVTLAQGGKFCWVCKAHTMKQRDEMWHEHK